jgi:hypothetical protein
VAERDPFAELADRARAEAASRARRRERSLTQQAAEAATLAGTLLDLAEAGSPVVIRTAAGRTHRGDIVSVGRDYCRVAVAGGTVYVALGAVVAVRPERRHPSPAAGDRPPPLDLHLGEALARLAPERPRIMVVAGTGEALSGELVAVGVDVLTLTLGGTRRDVCYVALGRLEEVFVPPAG